MKRLLALAALAAALLAWPAAAMAHPLGNFTINRYSQVEIAGDRVYVLYVLDMAEIPTFQAGRIDGAAYARQIAANVHLTVNGEPAVLEPLRHALAFPKGSGGLRTTRLEVLLQGPHVAAAGTRLAYRDANYANRIGWKEIVVRASGGASTPVSSAPSTSRSNALRAYPRDLLSDPLDVTSATATIDPGTGPASPPELTSGSALQAPDRVADHGFARLIGRGHLTPLVILASIGIALFWGMAHALSPGHGKTIVAAFLVGQRGKARHAAALGGIVTLTHTIGVFALGGVTLALSELIVPDTLYPWLNLASGVLVVAIGGSVLLGRLRGRLGDLHTIGARAGRASRLVLGRGVAARRTPAPTPAAAAASASPGRFHATLPVSRQGGSVSSSAHTHAHGGLTHSHGGREHSHVPETPGWRGLVAVGISGGLLPCPSALVVLLAAISLHRVAFGLVLIVAFSVGLALTITAIGLVAVFARKAFRRMSFDGPIVRLLPAASAIVILAAGIAMTARAFPKVS